MDKIHGLATAGDRDQRNDALVDLPWPKVIRPAQNVCNSLDHGGERCDQFCTVVVATAAGGWLLCSVRQSCIVSSGLVRLDWQPCRTSDIPVLAGWRHGAVVSGAGDDCCGILSLAGCGKFHGELVEHRKRVRISAGSFAGAVRACRARTDGAVVPHLDSIDADLRRRWRHRRYVPLAGAATIVGATGT